MGRSAAGESGRVDVDTLVTLLEHWRTGPGPAYLRLAQALEVTVRSGELKTGTVLPSERRLATALGIGRGTVVHAYEALAELGVVRRRQGSGTVTLVGNEDSRFFGTTRQASRGWIWAKVEPQAAARQRELVDLGSTAFREVPDVPDEALSFAPHDLRSLNPDHGYAIAGLPSLREAIAARLTVDGLPSTASQILVTTGAAQAISLVIAHLIHARDTAVTESPTYPTTIDMLGRAGAHIVTVRCPTDGVDVSKLRRAVGGASMLYLVATCNPAHGATLPAGARREVAELADRWGLAVLDDRARADFESPAPPPIAAEQDPARFLTVGSMSKLYWGGLRVGWLRASPEVVRRVARLKAVADLGSAVPSQVIAAKLLGLHDEVRRQRMGLLMTNSEIAAAAIREELPDWQIESVGGPNMFVHIGRASGDAFALCAESHGVILNSGSLFCPDDSHAHYIRLSLTVPSEELVEGMARLKRAWSTYARERPRDLGRRRKPHAELATDTSTVG